MRLKIRNHAFVLGIGHNGGQKKCGRQQHDGAIVTLFVALAGVGEILAVHLLSLGRFAILQIPQLVNQVHFAVFFKSDEAVHKLDATRLSVQQLTKG